MPDDIDDDPLPDWAKGPPTALDEVPPVPADDLPTAPHRTLGPEVDGAFEAGREAGCRSCFTEGQEDAIRALRDLFAESPGGVDDAAEHTIGRVRARLTKL